MTARLKYRGGSRPRHPISGRKRKGPAISSGVRVQILPLPWRLGSPAAMGLLGVQGGRDDLSAIAFKLQQSSLHSLGKGGVGLSRLTFPRIQARDIKPGIT